MSEAETKTEEELSAEETEAKEGFTSGFDKAMEGLRPSVDTPKPAETKDPEPEPKAEESTEADKEETEAKEAEVKEAEEAEAKAEADRKKFDDDLPGRLRVIEGRYGEILTKLDALATTKVAPKPTEKQVTAALNNPDAMAKLTTEYGAELIKPIESELLAIRKEAGDLDAKIDERFAEAETKREQKHTADAEATERDQLAAVHPNWEQDAVDPAFNEWAFDGGPSVERYEEVKPLLQTDPAKAQLVLDAWKRDYPKWWDDRGTAIFGSVDQTIKLLTDYKNRSNPPEEDAERAETERKEKARRERIVARAGTPDGTEAAPAPNKTEQQQFSSGFQKIMANRISGAGTLVQK